MAKLTQSNLMARDSAKATQVEKTEMLPPASRPQPKLPRTPSHNDRISNMGSEGQNSSSKKKRRKRGGKKNGDSASEIATTISEDTATELTRSVSINSEVLVQASQSQSSALPADASAEEKRVYENEPEMYDVYAESEDDQESEQLPISLPRRERVQTYSPSVVNGMLRSSPVRQSIIGNGQPLEIGSVKGRLSPDVTADSGVLVPKPQKMTSGRFKCPFAAQYECTSTFASAKGAKRHADMHVNADRFNCNECGKGFSRKDLLVRHLNTHKVQASPDERDEQTSVEQGDRVQQDSTSGMKKIRKKRTEALPADNSPKDEVETEKAQTNFPASDSQAVSNGYPTISQTEDEEEEDESTEKPVTSSKASALQQAQTRLPAAQKNLLKRKRPSSRLGNQPSASVSRKRVRRAEERPKRVSGVAVNARDDHEQGERPTRKYDRDLEDEHVSDTDVEIAGNDNVRKSKQQDVPDLEDETALSTASSQKQLRSTNTAPGAAARVYESDTSSAAEPIEAHELPREVTKDTHDSHSDEAADQQESQPPNVSTKVPSKPTPAIVQRQSSMDSFVQRSKATSNSVGGSSSGSRISVNVPVRSQSHAKKMQTVLYPQIESVCDQDDVLADGMEKNNSAVQPETTRNSKARNGETTKGKGKAQAEDSGKESSVNGSDEDASSEDRPRATTIARRTPSHGSKSTPKLKPRPILRTKKKQASDSDETEHAEKPRKKPKLSEFNKKRAKATSGRIALKEANAPTLADQPSTADVSWAEASKTGLTGRFSDEEHQILMSWRDAFCEHHGMSNYEFNEMMANTASIRKSDWKYNWISKNDFMRQFYDQLPERNRRSMIRFRERQFQNVEKSAWTEADDEDLNQLVVQYGTKWVEIGQLMGRTQDAVSQRWRHKLNYGEKPALMGDWTSDEVARLEEEVTAFARMKHTTPDDEDLQIPWVAISKKIGTGRTAQQCSNRWRINTTKRVHGKFVKVPHNDRIPGPKVKQPRTPSKMEKRLSGERSRQSGKHYKSAEKVVDSDEGSDEDAGNERKIGGGSGESHAEDEEDEERSQEALETDRRSNGGLSEAASQDDSQENGSVEQPDEEVSSTEITAKKTTSKSRSRKVSTHVKSQSKPEENVRPRRSHLVQKRSKPSPQDPQPPSSQGDKPQASSQSTITKTPATSKNPFKKTNQEQSTPGMALSMTQLHAGTQANSSTAKRTTSRTNRTRVPDTVFAEDRPSPSISLRGRPMRSSSPSMRLLIDASGAHIQDEEHAEQELSDEDDQASDIQVDLKSPSSFVSAPDKTERLDSDGEALSENEDEDSSSASQDASDSGSNSASGDNATSQSASGSQSASNTDSESEQDLDDAQTAHTQNNSSFWQSVNQNFRKVVGLSQGQSQTSSQSQSQDQSQNRRPKNRLSLTDVLRRGPVEVEDSESDDDE